VADPAPSTAFADENKPTSFYLGRAYDLPSKSVLDERIDYESRDLTTHGVVVGMTGSGKTGLCINLLEEAALDNIPCIMIDPKGDLTNLLLQFPNLAPEDYVPWINPDEAEQKGMSVEDYARHLSERWQKGLAETGQSPRRIQELRDKAEYRIYTPGSEAGLPLSILNKFTAPKEPMSREDLNQKIDATASALLGLTGVSADPVQSREHILIAQLLLHAWTQGKDLDLPRLIAQIQEPPVRTIGALDVETFYKEKERMKLAIALNNILAAPSFSTWLTGDPLDLNYLLAGSPGKTRQLIFYVAHLDDRQRMFFITLLLSEVLAWTRKQQGSTSLRALLYFDEVYGYLPPHPGNPPSKVPLMTLFKQARAFGVGVLLATQNPVDVDYKALSNAGTWFIGKLQTERDKARLLDGLEGAAAERGARSNRAVLEKTISSLGNRIFMLHNVHRGGEPKVFQSRWALSYLRGPMTRDEISRLMDPVRNAAPIAPAASPPPPPAPKPAPSVAATPSALPTAAATPPLAPPPPAPEPAPVAPLPAQTAASSPAPEAPVAVPPASSGPAGFTAARVVLPRELTQYYLPVKSPNPGGAQLAYQGFALAFVEVACNDKKLGKEYRETRRWLAPAVEGQPIDWTRAETIGPELEDRFQDDALWGPVPEPLNTAKKLRMLRESFQDYLNGLKIAVAINPTLNLFREPGEEADAFTARCREAAWQEFLKKLQAEKDTYGPEFKRYQASIPEDAFDPAAPWAERWQAFAAGAPVLRATPGRALSDREKSDLEKLEIEWHGVKVNLAERARRAADQRGELTLVPKKSDCKVTHFGLAWAPFWLVGGSDLRPAYRKT